MKKILLTILSLTLFFTAYSQKVDTADFKDYKPCTECLDNWKNTSNTGSVINKPNLKNNGAVNFFKSELRTVKTIVLSMVILAVVGVIINNVNKQLTNAPR
jgi:hypothetical protein